MYFYAILVTRQMAEAMEADMSPEQAKAASQRVSAWSMPGVFN